MGFFLMSPEERRRDLQERVRKTPIGQFMPQQRQPSDISCVEEQDIRHAAWNLLSPKYQLAAELFNGAPDVIPLVEQTLFRRRDNRLRPRRRQPPPGSTVTLVLMIENVGRLENDEPIRLELNGKGAVIGRGSAADWRLPETDVSRRHCEIVFRKRADNAPEYVINDTNSKNGTLIGSARTPLRAGDTYVLRDGDKIRLGPYHIRVGMMWTDEQPPSP